MKGEVMKQTAAINYEGSYADILLARLKQLGKEGRAMEVRDLARLSTYSYEHVRKLLKGEAVQSPKANEHICTALGLDVQRMWEIATREKLQKRLGDQFSPTILSPADPKMRALWPELSAAQRRRVLAIVEGMVEQNRASAEHFVAVAS